MELGRIVVEYVVLPGLISNFCANSPQVSGMAIHWLTPQFLLSRDTAKVWIRRAS